jgi:hypothetical protein
VVFRCSGDREEIILEEAGVVYVLLVPGIPFFVSKLLT